MTTQLSRQIAARLIGLDVGVQVRVATVLMGKYGDGEPVHPGAVGLIVAKSGTPGCWAVEFTDQSYVVHELLLEPV